MTYSPRDGIHDFANFRPQLRDAIAWDLFAPVEEHPVNWVNDTVATRGELWEFGYRFDSPPDRVVRFERTPDQLSIGAAGSAVTVTTQGCEFRIETPGELPLPVPCETEEPKARLKLKVTPRKIRAGRWTRVKVVVKPATKGTRAWLGKRRLAIGKQGVAHVKVCRKSKMFAPRIKATAPGHLPASMKLWVRGKPKRCGRMAKISATG